MHLLLMVTRWLRNGFECHSCCSLAMVEPVEKALEILKASDFSAAGRVVNTL